MMRARAMTLFLAGGMSLLAVAPAPAADNPYKGIVDRNAFSLIPPPPPAPAIVATPPSTIQLTGITTMLGKKLAMLMVTEPGPGKQPESYMLTEGERDREIEVVAIDDKAGSVKVKEAGVEQLLTFDKNAPKDTPGGPGLGGIPLPSPVGLPAPNRPGMYNNPGMRQIPNRELRPPTTAPAASAAPPVTPPANVAAANQAPAEPPMTPEVQTTMIEVNRVLTQDQVDKGELPPLPPTDMTPQDVVDKITTPSPGE